MNADARRALVIKQKIRRARQYFIRPCNPRKRLLPRSAGASKRGALRAAERRIQAHNCGKAVRLRFGELAPNRRGAAFNFPRE